MSEFNDLLKMLDVPETKLSEVVVKEALADSILEIIPPELQSYNLFDIDLFNKELYEKSSIRNQLYREAIQNISSYDIASGCIRDIIYKLNNTPVESFADKWLPILMRSTIGTAIHEFIQSNSNQFTEREVSLKIPSLRFSGRLDNLIGPTNLIEIKSCPYSDYEKIISSRKPRTKDFIQTMVYKYMLENYLEEAKDPNIPIREGSSKPKFDKYNIEKIQFIYVAHDITATDVDSFAEILDRIKQLKRMLNSKSNSFFFMTTLVINVDGDISAPYINFIENKIKAINKYMTTQQIPSMDDPFIDTKQCFFCLNKSTCNKQK